MVDKINAQYIGINIPLIQDYRRVQKLEEKSHDYVTPIREINPSKREEEPSHNDPEHKKPIGGLINIIV